MLQIAIIACLCFQSASSNPRSRVMSPAVASSPSPTRLSHRLKQAPTRSFNVKKLIQFLMINIYKIIFRMAKKNFLYYRIKRKYQHKITNHHLNYQMLIQNLFHIFLMKSLNINQMLNSMI
jgi:hypothetical protein